MPQQTRPRNECKTCHGEIENPKVPNQPYCSLLCVYWASIHRRGIPKNFAVRDYMKRQKQRRQTCES